MAAKAAVVVGGIVLAGVGGYLAYNYLVKGGGGGAGKFLLQILAGDGGSTSPASSPSGTFEPAGSVVTITATPKSGYTIGGWLLDGQEAGTSPSLTVTMNMDHNVIVTFWEGGEPPPSAPYAIVPVGGSATAWGFYGAKAISPLQDKYVHVLNCDQNWTWGNWAQYPAQFKVIDAAGKGVPGVDVTLFPDLFPDNGNNVGLVGYLALNLWPHSSSDPLILTTDANGIVTFSLTYVYGLTDSFKKLCQAAQLYLWVTTLFFGIPFGVTVYDMSSMSPGLSIFSKGGEGITNDRPPTMGYWTVNYVRASIADTAIQAVTLPVYCGFHVKFL